MKYYKEPSLEIFMLTESVVLGASGNVNMDTQIDDNE